MLPQRLYPPAPSARAHPGQACPTAWSRVRGRQRRGQRSLAIRKTAGWPQRGAEDASITPPLSVRERGEGARTSSVTTVTVEVKMTDAIDSALLYRPRTDSCLTSTV